jgi:hypothetical protein
MTRTKMADPFVEKYLSHRDNFPDWVNKAQVHNHIWTVPVPPSLEKGVHTIRIRAGNPTGDEQSGFVIFNVE